MSSLFSAATSFFGKAPPKPPATPETAFKAFLDRNPGVNQRKLQPNEGSRLDEFMTPETYKFVLDSLKESHPDFEFSDPKIVIDRETKRAALPSQIVKAQAALDAMRRELTRYESVAETDKLIMIAQQDLKVGDRASRYGARKVDEENPWTKKRRATKRRRNNCDDDDDDEKQVELEQQLRALDEAPAPPATPFAPFGLHITNSITPAESGEVTMTYSEYMKYVEKRMEEGRAWAKFVTDLRSSTTPRRSSRLAKTA